MFPLNNSYETFLLSTKGGNKLMFSCSGSCRPLKTWVGAKNVNFKSVALGNQIKKLFRIYNDSDIPTEFQIYHDNSGAFFFDVTEGIIPGKSNVRVNVTFRPYETIMYYQRVFCLIRNHSLFPIDLFGSCHDLLIKTPLIDMKQIPQRITIIILNLKNLVAIITPVIYNVRYLILFLTGHLVSILFLIQLMILLILRMIMNYQTVMLITYI